MHIFKNKSFIDTNICRMLRVSDCCLTPNDQFFSYIMWRTSYIQWNDVFLY